MADSAKEMCKEEQEMEMEALESIYMNNFASNFLITNIFSTAFDKNLQSYFSEAKYLQNSVNRYSRSPLMGAPARRKRLLFQTIHFEQTTILPPLHIL